MDAHEVLKPTTTEMREAIPIPEHVTPEGLRVRADIVRKSVGDESCARHLELAADEIDRLRADNPKREATGYSSHIDKGNKEAKITLVRGKRVLGYLVIPSEKVYDMGTHMLMLYDELEEIV